jgi:hypothetical protein
MMSAAPELTGKLDAPGTPEVNGPDDEIPDWYSIDWGKAEENVRRLRQRIFTATREGDLKKVRNLQKLMLRSRSNALVAARRVAEVNAGRKPPGVEISGEHRRSLRLQELPPPRIGAPLRCRGNLQSLEDPADRRCAGPVAKLEQFALDPLVSPGVVLGGEPLYQSGYPGADRRPSPGADRSTCERPGGGATAGRGRE